MQWVIYLGVFCICTHVVTMPSFRYALLQGLLDRVKGIYTYLDKTIYAYIQVWKEEPDYSVLPDQKFYWGYYVYGEVKDLIPGDWPTPLGDYLRLTHYVDANLIHNQITVRSVTGILHLVNKTPVDWYSKKQSTVETYAYGSEFFYSWTCVYHIIYFRGNIWYLGGAILYKKLNVWR